MIHPLVALLAGAWHDAAGVSLGALALGLALHSAKLTAEARSWHWVLRHAHPRSAVDFRTTLCAFIGSIGANAVLPARVGEAFRIGVVRRRVPGSSVVTIAATVILETAVEALFGIGVIASVLLSSRVPGHRGSGVVPSFALGRVGLGVAGAAILATLVLAVVCRGATRRLWARVAAGLSIAWSPWLFATQVLSWKVVAWVLRLASVYAFLIAFHVPAAIWAVLLVVAAQNVAGAIPLLPGNAGTQQAAIAVALAGSASGAALLGFGVGMQAATAATDLALGACAAAVVATRGEFREALAAARLPRSRPEAART